MVTAPVEVGKDREEMRESEMPATITDHQFQNPSFFYIQKIQLPNSTMYIQIHEHSLPQQLYKDQDVCVLLQFPRVFIFKETLEEQLGSSKVIFNQLCIDTILLEMFPDFSPPSRCDSRCFLKCLACTPHSTYLSKHIITQKTSTKNIKSRGITN